VDVLPRPDPSASPLAFFGYELRRIREEAGLTQEQLGELINYSGAQVSAVENAKRNPKKDFADRCDEALNTGGHLASTWVMVRRGAHRPPVRSFLELEREATCIRNFQPLNVPGLLQTEAYARALMRAACPGDEDEQIEARVAERMERKKILQGVSPVRLFAVIDEIVLHRRVGDERTMSDQLQTLLDTLSRPRTTLQVIPASTGAHPGLNGPIVLLSFQRSPDVVYFDHAGGGQVVDSPDDVAEASYLFDALRTEALPQSASSELIREALKRWT
jgi:transcriptional regulator with XRE-family HTH domain